MSWMQKLYETYESNSGRTMSVGDRKPLLPIAHAIQQAHIEVVLDAGGNFKRAEAIDAADTIIPATESSSLRTMNDAPHGLSDKIQYIAGDYAHFGGRKRSYFESYHKQLLEWCSKDPSPKAAAVLKYIEKQCLVADLVRSGVLHLDAQEKLLTSWVQTGVAPKVFRTLTKKDGVQDQGDALVRWRVETPGDPLSATWEDKDLIEAWSKFATGGMTDAGLCQVTGETRILARKHPAKLRSGKDGAKLVSSNDEAGYTFRGRFLFADEAATVGSDVTQKAHSALRWLMGRKQAYQNGSQFIVTWAISGHDIPDPLADSSILFSDAPEIAMKFAAKTFSDAGQVFAIRLSKLIAGYKARLGPKDEIVTMGLDSAVPGRMAVTFYRDLKGADFLDRVSNWHESFAWFQRLSFDQRFVGAPAPKDIADAAFGSRADEKVRRATVERLLPCIIDGRQLPRDLMDVAVRRAANRIGMQTSRRKIGKVQITDESEWEKLLGIACSLFRGFHRERKYTMALETDRKTRDYLYGRLLAIAEVLEGRALYLGKENRDTTAARLMQRFCDQPYSTWLNIEKGLQPYRSRLQSKQPGFLHWITGLLDEVHCLFEANDYTNDTPLKGEYLLGYHCQRRALYEQRHDETTTDEQNDGSDE